MHKSKYLLLFSLPMFVACGSDSTSETDKGGDGDMAGDGDGDMIGDGDGDMAGDGDGDAATGGDMGMGGDTATGGDTASGGTGTGGTGTGGSTSVMCDPGMQDNDEDGMCSEECSVSSCTNEGTCDDASGAIVCACTSGWGGVDCATVDCTGIDCSGDGTGTCDDTGAAVACTCDGGFQDNDENLSCDAACDVDTCSGNGTCSDGIGATFCLCDTGYAGDACNACDTANGFAADGEVCGLAIIGGLVPGDASKWFDGTVAANCQEYLIPPAGYVYEGDIGDGFYEISPDGGAAFEVYCDQTTNGGGWTMLDQAVGNVDFGVSITTLEGTCVLNGNNPQATDAGGPHTCLFDYALGFDFNQVFADALEITAVAGQSGDTSDLAFDDSADWTRGCSNGDIRLGGAANTTSAMSLGQESGGTPGCGLRASYLDMESFTVTAQSTLASNDQTLRILMSEFGGELEGWEWTDGMIGVRNATSVVGALTFGNPGEWSEGTYAVSCAAYATSGVDGTALRSGSAAAGYFIIDADGDGSGPSEIVYCSGGAEWTVVHEWNREADPTNNTLASLLAGLTDDLVGPPTGISLMGDLSEQATYVRWSDFDSTFDALSYSIDLSSYGATQVLLDIEFLGTSHEDAAVWFYVESTTAGATNLVCNDENVSGNDIFSTEELALVPYACASTINGEISFSGVYVQDVGETINTFVMRSLMADGGLGDTSQLYRLNIAVR